MKRILVSAFLAACVAAPVVAAETEGGELNPEEMTWRSFRKQAENGQSGMVMCAMGYAMAKAGDFETARIIFERCAADGYTGAMTWMSYLEQNGAGGEFNPDAAAEWDRRAAEAGDPIGMFNHGVNMMRGFGTAQDETAGRAMVDQAAQAGLDIAKRLQGADYDLDEVTPDADNWRYAPMF
ncbi:tetratricopeptide repeat protein [Aliiroseovarius sp. PTFE2010]|uniref:tetratricopeptide repeat protein n=1 Tax=Aliiroseovarius sp. PTFE2010 TaxID=3417190 RepID=UPI003CF4F1D6